jgi:hypothetical protein
MINAVTANPTPPLVTPGRPWDRSGRRFGSPDKAKQMLGLATTVGIREGLERTVAWTRTHLSQIESCMARHRDALASYERSHQNALT